MPTFEELGVRQDIASSAVRMGWSGPTPIQAMAIPAGIAGRDLLAQARTGTGKTGAYSMVVLSRIRPGGQRPAALVIAPTRELADQVSSEMRSLSSGSRHVVVAVYGGARMSDQVRRLSRGCDVVVGTPGRTLDLCKRGHLDLSGIRELVMDEADRMLDMGFEEEVRSIVSLLPRSRHTMMFSATFPDEVRRAAGAWTVGCQEVVASSGQVSADSVEQMYSVMERGSKYGILKAILSNGKPKALVFCGTKAMVDGLASRLSEDGFGTGSIHGDMPQSRREKVIRMFRSDRFPVLVATDVAARGLDIDGIECVVNYDVPDDPETYVHRIGRAGRAGSTGYAVTFVTPKERWRIGMCEEAAGVRIRKVPAEDAMSLDLSGPCAGRRQERPPEKAPEPVPERSMVRIALNVGKTDGVDRNDIREFLIVKAGVPEGHIGHIGLGKRASFVEIDSSSADTAIRGSERKRLGPVGVHASVAAEKVRFKDRARGRHMSGATPGAMLI